MDIEWKLQECLKYMESIEANVSFSIGNKLHMVKSKYIHHCKFSFFYRFVLDAPGLSISVGIDPFIYICNFKVCSSITKKFIRTFMFPSNVKGAVGILNYLNALSSNPCYRLVIRNITKHQVKYL